VAAAVLAGLRAAVHASGAGRHHIRLPPRVLRAGRHDSLLRVFFAALPLLVRFSAVHADLHVLEGRACLPAHDVFHHGDLHNYRDGVFHLSHLPESAPGGISAGQHLHQISGVVLRLRYQHQRLPVHPRHRLLRGHERRLGHEKVPDPWMAVVFRPVRRADQYFHCVCEAALRAGCFVGPAGVRRGCADGVYAEDTKKGKSPGTGKAFPIKLKRARCKTNLGEKQRIGQPERVGRFSVLR